MQVTLCFAEAVCITDQIRYAIPQRNAMEYSLVYEADHAYSYLLGMRGCNSFWQRFQIIFETQLWCEAGNILQWIVSLIFMQISVCLSSFIEKWEYSLVLSVCSLWRLCLGWELDIHLWLKFQFEDKGNGHDISQWGSWGKLSLVSNFNHKLDKFI